MNIHTQQTTSRFCIIYYPAFALLCLFYINTVIIYSPGRHGQTPSAGQWLTHIPLSWAIGEQVIGGWAPSGPFPEFCVAIVEPAEQHKARTWRFRHPLYTALTWQISAWFNRVFVTKAVTLKENVLHELNLRLCMKARSRENGFILATHLSCFNLEGNCRNCCNKKTLKDHLCLSLCISFQWPRSYLVQKGFLLFDWKTREKSVLSERFDLSNNVKGFDAKFSLYARNPLTLATVY